MDATAKLIAIVVLAAFATERILAAAGYFMDAKRPRENERQKFLLLGLVIRLLNPAHSVGIQLLDYWLTWLIVFAGADRVRDLLQGAMGTPAAEHKETPAFRIHVDGGSIHELRPAS